MNDFYFSWVASLRMLCAVIVVTASSVSVKADTYDIFVEKNILGLRSVCNMAFFLSSTINSNATSKGSLRYELSTNLDMKKVKFNRDTLVFLISTGVVNAEEIKSVKALQKNLRKLANPKIFVPIDNVSRGKDDKMAFGYGQFEKTIFHYDNGNCYCERLISSGTILD